MSKALDVFDASMLDKFASIEEAFAYAESLGFSAADNDADGVKSLDIITDKDQLINVPFLIVEWRFHNSTKFEGEFCSLEIMDKDGNRAIVNDGSTGICKQLRELSAHRVENEHAAPNALRMVAGGLSRSDYETEDAAGKTIQASTYYLKF